MKICIPTKDTNPNLFSEVTICPLEAKSFILFNSGNQEIVSLTIPNIRTHTFNEIIGSLLQIHNVNSIVANSYCKEFQNSMNTDNIELWQCTASTVNDTINIFKLGGSFLYDEKLSNNHPHISSSNIF